MAADRNYRSYADTAHVYIESETIEPPDPNFADTLKFSNVQGATVLGCKILGSQEDAVDCNRGCTDIDFGNCEIYPAGRYGFTIKGGSSEIRLLNVTFFGSAKSCEIELGNWSDQSQEKTTGVVLLNCTRADGKPVRVRVGHADMPEISGGNVKIDRLGSLALKAYWWARYFLHRIGVK